MRVHLSRALAPILRDLEVTGAPLPRVEESDWQSWPTADAALLWSASGSGTGVWVDTAVSEADQVAMLADQVQTWAIEELWPKNQTNWPPCPEHPQNHPLAAVVHHGTAAWKCPTSGRRICEIGQLDGA